MSPSLFDQPFEEEPERTDPPARPRVLTVSQLTRAVQHTLESGYPRVWVEGEVADCRHAQHLYFTLKDSGAQLPAVMWRTDALRLRFKLATGMHVIAKGRLTVYPPHGRYQMTVDALEVRGAGALQAAFEQLKARLDREGLFDPARKRRLPVLPQRIGVVTSREGAAVRDIVRVLRTRRAPSEVIISPTRVQGDGAAAEIAEALRRVVRVPGVDVVIVARGGGSLEDLWAFNDEIVARAIVASPVPVITGVGHETDTTIADFVADVRAATPSQAAEIVVRGSHDFRKHLEADERQLASALRSRLDRRRMRLFQIEKRPAFAHFRDRVLNRDRLRNDLYDRLCTALTSRIHAQRRHVIDVTRRLDDQHPQRQLTARLRRLSLLDERLQGCGLDRRLEQAGRLVDARLHRARAALDASHHAADRRLSSLSAQLDALSPLRTLGRGYAICWEETRETALRSVSGTAPGDAVHVQLTDGILTCDVRVIDRAPNAER